MCGTAPVQVNEAVTAATLPSVVSVTSELWPPSPAGWQRTGIASVVTTCCGVAAILHDDST